MRQRADFALQGDARLERLSCGLPDMESESLVGEDGCIAHAAKRRNVSLRSAVGSRACSRSLMERLARTQRTREDMIARAAPEIGLLRAAEQDVLGDVEFRKRKPDAGLSGATIPARPEPFRLDDHQITVRARLCIATCVRAERDRQLGISRLNDGRRHLPRQRIVDLRHARFQPAPCAFSLDRVVLPSRQAATSANGSGSISSASRTRNVMDK